jgi:hypothetical protein
MRIKPVAVLLAGCVAMLVGAFFMFTALPAKAGSTGIENIHTLKREGGRLCMVGHYHYGAGDSEKSKQLALKKAYAKWFEFVDIEYGSDWSRFALAANKGIKCRPENGGTHCSVKGRPCKALRAGSRRHKSKRRHRRNKRR